MPERAGMTGESPIERQIWLYRELYGLPCQVSGIRITLSTSDVSAVNAPNGLAALIDDELFWSKRVTPILDEGKGGSDLILLAAPSPLDLTRCAADLRRRARCEFLPPGIHITLPSPLPPPGPEPHWFRYPQYEMLQPLTAVLRAIRIVLRDIPRTYPA
ncbi:hypothetical protein [Nocardia aurantiaca]|uniref:Uncharacterized protein n=1 Tax=Nocardia aurantiaca TaxID=2675850 RepID=A0A6I3L7K4_9NOCA|nr:hypothetical protein [Nocardia aurantiaca]MTE17378.1 hypothetical protein [Nocardia aurantiaca]